MATCEYRVIQHEREELERALNVLAEEGWRPILIVPDAFGGASFTNFGPGRVDSFCVVLERE
jgi:hypothetical protein